jgi:hypothetical protein
MAQPFDPWQNYRQRRRLLVGSTLAGLALFIAGGCIARAQHAVPPFYIGLGLFVGLVAWGTAPLADFPCPKCGEPFVHKGRRRNMFARACLHCQHPKWAPAPETDPTRQRH